jgi:hypothetical protein
MLRPCGEILHILSADANIEGPADKLSRFDFDAVADAYEKWYETAQGAMYDRIEKKAVFQIPSTKCSGNEIAGGWMRYRSLE